ncbi:heparan-alpha-glucosaminide N-acetyltransferase [Apostasia shenzhenica]|uniref:Heparan-alpha-glucosaminide N-acetyltransferase n=1 Tax=Apostasia shenzhenica TaxID=1088818 RepID=A0A2H9ZS88_9ASPA|nr:heparan-alpha-glucosaminide N-acetyltransferase [Apostasia shenzhenica]
MHPYFFRENGSGKRAIGLWSALRIPRSPSSSGNGGLCPTERRRRGRKGSGEGGESEETSSRLSRRLPWPFHCSYDVCRLCWFYLSFNCSLPLAWCTPSRFCHAFFSIHRWDISFTCIQGGYFHGVNSLTFGVDVEVVRLFGILQRIAVGYIIAALCEIWFSNFSTTNAALVGLWFFKNYFIHWITVLSLSGIYLGLLYGLFVTDWQFENQQSTLSISYRNSSNIVKKVKCGVRGDLGPACNAAGMIDRYVLGIEHLYKKPAYRNLEVCMSSVVSDLSNFSPSWCQAPFEPEGLLGSLMAAVTCILGLHFGHILVQLEVQAFQLSLQRTHWE